MQLSFRQLNPHACRTYLVSEKDTNEVVIIDPVLDHLRDYLKLLESEKLKLISVIDTHTHADHISCSSALRGITDCEYIMHKNGPAQCVSKHVEDGDELNILGINVNVMYTPGHTNDSISLIFPDRLFTGDVLFLDDAGAGRDDLPGGDPESHWESLQKILKLPDHLIVYPAHEYRNREPSEISRQRITNPHLKSRSKEEFTQYIEDLRLGPADWMKDVLNANYSCARDPKAAWVPVDVPACEVKGTLDYGVNDIEIEPISVQELKTKINSNNPPLLLDVREEHELVSELGHLPGIKHIPISTLTARLAELDDDKNREIIAVCRSGARAHTAAQIMKQVGFNKVKVMEGGMIAWLGAGLPVLRQWNGEDT